MSLMDAQVVKLSPVVALNIIQHCVRSDHMVGATGQLLGVDTGSALLVTCSFPFATKSLDDDAALDTDFQLRMLRAVRASNRDAYTVGWYSSGHFGAFWSTSFIETMFNYQSTIPQSVVLIYDPTRATPLTALRLSNGFVEMYRSKSKFSLEALQLNQLTPQDVFEELEVQIETTKLMSALLCSIDTETLKLVESINEPTTSLCSKITDEFRSPFAVQHELLGIPKDDSYLVSSLEFLGEAMDDFNQEQWRWQGWHRNLSKEQAKLNALLAKKKDSRDEEVQTVSTNLSRIQASEPSRLESLVLGCQIDTHCNLLAEHTETTQFKIDILEKA